MERNSHPEGVFSGSNLVKQCWGTHSLKECLAILISGAAAKGLTRWGCPAILVSGTDPMKHLRGTHNLEGCSAILISGSNLVKQTHNLEACSAILVSSFDLVKLDTQSGGISSSYSQWFWSAERWTHSLEMVHQFPSVDPIYWDDEERLTSWRCDQPFSSAFLIWENMEGGTHILEVWLAILISISDMIKRRGYSHTGVWFTSDPWFWCDELWKGTHKL